MKRLTMIVALALILSLPTWANHVSTETAQKVAKTFLSNNGAKADTLTDLSKAIGFPNLYIFSANEGFLILASDDCVQPILGYSLTGKLTAENMPPNVREWLQYYNDEIQYAIENQLRATTKTIQLWNDLTAGKPNVAKATIVVDALVETQWGQKKGYNDLCPYDFNAGELTVTGCVATATAQILRYWQYPSHGVGSHSYTPSTHPEYGIQSVNFASATYDWAEMPLYSSTTEVAELMYHCGVSVNMDYNISANGGSVAYNNTISPALINYFHYKTSACLKYKSSYNHNNWISLIKSELNAARPVEYIGFGNGEGHAFICDGYDNSNYFHFNWGWYGNYDGYYTLTSLTPGNGGSGGSNYNYTNNQCAVIGIEPKACTLSSPTNLSISSDYSDAFLSWDEVAGAVSYYIYRNNVLIANTTENTYSDCNLDYGTYSYYIKCKDTFGALSSPSSTVSVNIMPTLFNLTITKNDNDAILDWTEPEGNVTQGDDVMLTYGDGSFSNSFGLGNGKKSYYGHRYPSSMLGENLMLNKVSFYATEAGAFTLLVYASNAGNNHPQTLLLTDSTIVVPSTGWNDIFIDNPLQIDHTKDLWVFIYDQEGKDKPMGYGLYNGNYGNYISFSPYDPTRFTSTMPGIAILIRTYFTSGLPTYDLYDNGTLVAQNLSGTSYSIPNIPSNTAHKYTIKFHYNGETYSSNMAGLTIGDASLSSLNLGTNDKMTITEGSKLTVNGILHNVNADNLILEDGAQLINNSTGVKATVLKNTISSSSVNDNWQLISSPFSTDIEPTVENGILNGAYNLYYYDEPTCYWMNYKLMPFNIMQGIGYLYANDEAEGSTLQLTGTLQPSGNSFTISNLSFCGEFLTGFHLVGNPFPCNATVNKDVYVLNNQGDGIILAESGRIITPCESIFVQLSNEFDSVVFSRVSSRNETTAHAFDLVLSQGQSHIDRVRVRFGEGNGVKKKNFHDNDDFLCITQDENNYAVAFVKNHGALSLNYHVSTNGIFTISFETETNHLSYLHLIDQLTGKEIDLLAEPTYTFEANPQDHPNRFKLRYSIVE